MPGTASVSLTDAQALRNYIETYRDDLTVQAFTDFQAADFAIGIEGVKGKQILPKMLVGKLSKRWTKAFTPPEDVIKFGFDVIEVEGAKIELQLYPQDFENNQITGRKRGAGFSNMAIPFEQQMMSQVFEKLDQEISHAFWNAVKTPTPAAGDDLDVLFDGQKGIFMKLANTGKIGLLPIPGGAYTIDNIIPHFKNMRLAQGAAYRKEDNYFLTSPEVGSLYFDAITKLQPTRTPETKTDSEGNRWIRTFDNTTWIVEVNDLSGSDFVAILGKNRMFYAFDAFSDTAAFSTMQMHRSVDFWMDYKFGVQLVVPEPNAVIYNGK